MDAATVTAVSIYFLLAVNVWAIAHGGILLGFLWKSKSKATVLTGLFVAVSTLVLNAATWILILAISLLYPQVPAIDSRPLWVKIGTGASFFGASISVAYALHHMRSIMMTPGKKTTGG